MFRVLFFFVVLIILAVGCGLARRAARRNHADLARLPDRNFDFGRARDSVSPLSLQSCCSGARCVSSFDCRPMFPLPTGRAAAKGAMPRCREASSPWARGMRDSPSNPPPRRRDICRNEPLALLLRAEAAQLAGDHHAVEAAFKEMTRRTDMRLLGFRGLHAHAHRRGDIDAAHHFASTAHGITALPWTATAVLEKHVTAKDWEGALVALDNSGALIDRTTRDRQRAILATAIALDKETDRAGRGAPSCAFGGQTRTGSRAGGRARGAAFVPAREASGRRQK